MRRVLKIVLVELWWLHLSMIIIYSYGIYVAKIESDHTKLEELYSRWIGFPIYIALLLVFFFLADKFENKNRLYSMYKFNYT